MKRSTYEQFAIVKADSASLFEDELNAEVFRLKDNNPVVKFSESIPLYAQISYRLKLEEEKKDEIPAPCFVCCQCPYFEPATRSDGEIDKRVKWGNCEHTEMGRTPKTAPACEKLYALIKEGDVKLCFMD